MRAHARRREDLALGAGILVLIGVLGPWFDTLADRSFAWHMLQHVAIMLVAAPLLLLGAPLRRVLAALPVSSARRLARLLHGPVLGVLGSPVVGWLAFAMVLYATHFSPMYEAALEHPAVHAFEHGLYLAVALAFWNPILAVPPSPNVLSFPARIFYVFTAMPIGGFLALAIYTASHPMYPYYTARLGEAGALADQAYGGEIMWISGGFALFVALMSLASQ
ncbi:MAG: cytochrome c oxidase assembly protein, partial [Vulcanimicrobiaceae bacterium]